MKNLNVTELTKNYTIEIHLYGVCKFTARTKIASWFLRIAAFFAPFEVITTEYCSVPWLFYCPFCGKDTFCYAPISQGWFTPICRHCNRQCLAQVDGSSAKIVKDPQCNQGCHTAEPYGSFVVMAGRTEHD